MSDLVVAEAVVQPAVIGELGAKFGDDCQFQATADGIPTAWVPAERIVDVMRFLKTEVESPYPLLFDLSAIDERLRQHRGEQPESDFTVFYHLMSLERNEDLRIKVALPEAAAALPSITAIWPAANWYEREAFDMFGLDFEGHPNLRRILTPPLWEAHPLRKDHPARAIR